jgi:hypothetical protein
MARFAHGRRHRGGGKRPDWITAEMDVIQKRVIALNRRDRRDRPAKDVDIPIASVPVADDDTIT